MLVGAIFSLDIPTHKEICSQAIILTLNVAFAE